ncbi:uncharacterized protein LOC118757305 [Rhagoletis pomonella]|uniref:uncharacterized protein LOC118757305 n=1 Tax=Rhagoletis pomonella TaxID=28610 RepID=UPI00177D481C|nr:uncharacterized protein LOC118757305 [Rhagoletis pomonella]
MDETEVVIEIENCDSDDADAMLAQIKKELADGSAPVTPEKENIELSVCTKSEKDEPDSTYNIIESIDIDDASPLVASQTVDKFIIYELDQDNFKNDVPAMLEKPQSAEIEAYQKPAKEINEFNAAKRHFPNLNDISKTTSPMDNPLLEINDIALNDAQDIISLVSSDEDEVNVTNGYPIRKSNTDTTTLSNSKNAKSKKRKHTDVEADEKNDTVKNYHHISTDVFTQLELKDFFERAFEETRKLSIRRRQIIKMWLFKAVCKAQEDVEAKKFCAPCYKAKRKAVKWKR